jgi:hypothetical protein
MAFTKKHLFINAVLAASTFLAGAVSAEEAPDSLHAGQVACLSLKDARNYASYSKEAPAFAVDLINRAACFIPKENMAAVHVVDSKEYKKIKLLSGHLVWVARN